MEQGVGRQHGDAREADECRQAREAPVHHREQLLEQGGHHQVGDEHGEVRDASGAVQGLGRHDIRRRPRRIGPRHQTAAHHGLGEDPRHYGDEVGHASEPRLQAHRPFRRRGHPPAPAAAQSAVPRPQPPSIGICTPVT